MSSTEPLRVLAVGADPDDVDFNAAGTIAKWTSEGADVHYLIITSGDAGGFGSVPRAEIIATRREEQRRARNPFAFSEPADAGLDARVVSELWLTAHPRAQHAEVVGDHFPRKVKALTHHASQPPIPEQLEAGPRSRMTEAADRLGCEPGALVEAFLWADVSE